MFNVYVVKKYWRITVVFIKITSKVSTFIATVLLVACSENTEISVSNEGHETFNRIANQEVEFALSGNIKKEPGFDSNCSVHKENEDGIFITRGVCDKENSFNIRVTNSTDYPPSKKLKFISLHYDNSKMTLNLGEIKEIIGPNNNKISVELSRTGSSLFIEGKQSNQSL